MKTTDGDRSVSPITSIKIRKIAKDDIELVKIFFELYNHVILNEDDLLTESEIKMLCLFMTLPHDKFKHQRFGTLAKKKVIEASKVIGWDLSTINLNNKMYTLINKGILRRDEDNVVCISAKIEMAIKELLESKRLNFVYEIYLEKPSD